MPRFINTRFDESYLDYWSDIWLATKLSENGVSLERFLDNPSRYLDEDDTGFLPLLPKQQRIAEELTRDLERGVEDYPRRNGAIVEPLHHHAHPRSASRDFVPKKAEGEQS